MRIPPTAGLVCRSSSTAVGWLLGLALLLGACGDHSRTGSEAEACRPPRYFTLLPVPAANITSVPVLGGVEAPGHVTPTDHGAFFLDGSDVPVVAPADIVITELRRVHYTGPDLPPEGLEDYAIFFRVCREVSGWFGLAAGEPLGFGTGGIDFGVVDTRVTNFYVRPEWHCQSVLFSKLRDGLRPGIQPTGKPRCGAMEVDVAGTARGPWAEPGVTAPLTAANERGLIAAAGASPCSDDPSTWSFSPASVTLIR